MSKINKVPVGSATSGRSKSAIYITNGLAAILVALGLYLLWLTLAPSSLPIVGQPKSAIDLNISDDEADVRNRIQISKINLEVPFYTDGESSLDKGAWHRYPDRGDPKNGGNFILSAHRFNIGITPTQTRLRSPFYELDRLAVGDGLRIYYEGQWYDYRVTRLYDVKPNAVEIEAPSSKPKLTLYSCTLEGSSDGRIVVEAELDTPLESNPSS